MLCLFYGKPDSLCIQKVFQLHIKKLNKFFYLCSYLECKDEQFATRLLRWDYGMSATSVCRSF